MVDRDFWPALTIRTLIGTFSFLGVCVGMQLLPLSIQTLIMNTAPFSTALLTFLWLKEPISKVDIIAMFGAYLGIVIVT